MSVLSPWTGGQWPAMVYRPHRWNRPGMGKVMAFARLDSACRFRERLLVTSETGAQYRALRYLELWRCLTPTYETCQKVLAIRDLTPQTVKLFWRGRLDLEQFELSIAPPGTVACPKVKLLERVL